MARPFAVIGFTVFLTISLLFDCDTGVTVAAFAAFTAALVVTLFIDKLRKQGALPCIFASAAVACALLFCAEQFVYSPALAYSGKTCEASAVLTDMPEIKYGNYYYEAKASEIDGKPADLKLRLVFSEPPEAEPYDILQGRFTFYTIGSSDSDFLAANKADGVFLGAYPENYDYSVISVPERKAVCQENNGFARGNQKFNLQNTAQRKRCARRCAYSRRQERFIRRNGGSVSFIGYYAYYLCVGSASVALVDADFFGS